jgi:hypothetical protein
VSDQIEAPRIFQHRFGSLTPGDFLQAAGQDIIPAIPMPTGLSTVSKSGSALFSLGADRLKSCVGHYLHPFLNAKGVLEAKEKFDKAPKAPKAAKEGPKSQGAGTEVKDEDRQLLALQVVEALRAEEQNKKSDAEEAARFKAEAEYWKSAGAPLGWWEKVAGWFNSSKKGRGKDVITNEQRKEIKADEIIEAGREVADGDVTWFSEVRERAKSAGISMPAGGKEADQSQTRSKSVDAAAEKQKEEANKEGTKPKIKNPLVRNVPGGTSPLASHLSADHPGKSQSRNVDGNLKELPKNEVKGKGGNLSHLVREDHFKPK